MITTLTPVRKEKGVVLVLVALSLVVLMGVAGLAIDLSHAEVNKTRLQNLADALALSAAISLNKGESSTAFPDKEEYAENYAKTTTLPSFESASGNNEVNLAAAAFTFTFAADWSSNGGDWYAYNAINGAKFARVEVTTPMSIPTWFARIMGFNNMAVASSAVAGTAPIEPCDLAPIMMCTTLTNPDPTTPPVITDPDCNNDTNKKLISVANGGDAVNGDLDCYGYELNALYCMKSQIGGTADPLCPDPPNAIGAGNFGWLDLGLSLEKCAAGDPACGTNCRYSKDPVSGFSTVPVKTGEVYDQAKDGFNTRFNQYPSGGGPNALTAAKYPPDKVIGVDGGTMNGTLTKVQTIGSETVLSPEIYNYYKGTVSDVPSNQSVALKGRRLMSVPFVDCRTPLTGASTDVKIVGFGCFLMAREYGNISSPYEHEPKPWPADKKYLYGVFLGGGACESLGELTSNSNYGYYKVILYKDPFGGHS